MTKSDKRIKLAAYEGLEPSGIEGFPWRRVTDKVIQCLNTEYFRSDSAVHRILRTLDWQTLKRYDMALDRQVSGNRSGEMFASSIRCHQATADQKAEALGVAVELWK